MKILTFSLGMWFLFMILAIINAGIRNEVYKSLVGDLMAHQIGTVLFIVVILFMRKIFLLPI